MTIDFPGMQELGTEYANIVLASEWGVDPLGNSIEKPLGTLDRQLEIEEVFSNHNNHTLPQYVETAMDAAGI